MKYTYHVLHPKELEPLPYGLELPEPHDFGPLRKIIERTVGGHLEHVSVRHPEWGPADMFVNEIGAILGLPINPLATALYRNATLSRHPKTDPATLPAIFGPALVFKERVWR